jgi:AraC-like DNA-binding protein
MHLLRLPEKLHKNAMAGSSPTTSIERLPFTEWANLHAHLIFIYDGKVESRWRKGVVESPYLTAWLVRKGQVKVRTQGKVLTASAGQWIFPPPSDKLWREFSDDTQLLSVRYRASWPTGDDLFNEGLGLVFNAKEHPELERAAKPLAVFTAKHFPKGYRYLMEEPATLTQHLRLQVLFTKWLDVSVETLIKRGLTPSRMGRIDTRLLKAVHLLEKKGLATTISERTLAKEVGLSISQLARLFRRQFGISARTYGEKQRHEYARAALQSSPQTIKEIAFQLGFSSLPHFSVWFRRKNGVSPRAYRKPARQ